MAKGINKVILIGNLGADPETRFTAGNMPVSNLSIATSEQWTDKQSGQKQEKTEWHRVVLFNKTAEIAQQYLRKGSKVYIEGRLETQKWQDQNGQDKYTTQIVANDMQMLDSPSGGGQQGQSQQRMQQGSYQQQPQQPQQGGYQQPQQPQGSYQQPQQNGQNGQTDYRGHSGSNQPNPTCSQPQGAGGAVSDFDDKIPFAALHDIYGG